MYEPKVLEPSHKDMILQFERLLLEEKIADPMEREMTSWHASWREESLAHYLPLGWSFGLFQDGILAGYFLAQPQLFMGGLTQTLWVELLSAPRAQLVSELIEVAYRIARDKHFQRVVFRCDEKNDLSHGVLQLSRIADNLFELKTAKF